MKKFIVSIAMFAFVCGSFVALAQDPVKPATEQSCEETKCEEAPAQEETPAEAPVQEEAPAEAAE